MSDLVLVALINGTFGVLVLVGGARLNGKVKRVQADSRASREQLENNHDTNLREEGDDRHAENTTKLDTILERQAEQGNEIKGLRKSVGRLFERQAEHTDQIHDLELTQPRGRFAPPARHRGD